MKTDIYTLLGMIKDGKAPKKIAFKEDIYEYRCSDCIDYYCDKDCVWLFDDYDITDILNDEVEILETTITHNQDEPTFKEIDGEWYVRTDFRPDGNIIFVEKAKQDKIEKIDMFDYFTGYWYKELPKDFLEHLENNFETLNSKINEIIDKLNKGEK